MALLQFPLAMKICRQRLLNRFVALIPWFQCKPKSKIIEMSKVVNSDQIRLLKWDKMNRR